MLDWKHLWKFTTFENYLLIAQERLHQQAGEKARRSGAATGIWWRYSAWPAAGWSSGLACWGWSPQEAEDSQAVDGLVLYLLTWCWQLEAIGLQHISTTSVGFCYLLWILYILSISSSKALRGHQPTWFIVFIADKWSVDIETKQTYGSEVNPMVQKSKTYKISSLY